MRSRGRKRQEPSHSAGSKPARPRAGRGPTHRRELTVSHGAWQGPRADFRKWRDQLTLAAGYMIAVFTMREQEQRLPLINGQAITASSWVGDWDITPADPLVVLINHSDRHGRIHPREATALADRLEELCTDATSQRQQPKPTDPIDELLLSIWAEADSADDMFREVSENLDVRVTQQFIHGLRAAATADEPLVFS